MTEEISSLCDLAARLRPGFALRLGVDGINGARKTTVAGALAMELNLPLISLDDFLQTDQGGFVEFLRYPELAEALIARQNFVVEGVCLNQVLNRIQVRLTTCVYVKRYHLDLWADERELDIPEDSVEEFLEKEREFAARLSGAEIERGPCLSDDIIRYHSRFRPHEHAHYVFRWDER